MNQKAKRIGSWLALLIMLAQSFPIAAIADQTEYAAEVVMPTRHAVRFLDVEGEPVGATLYVAHGGSVTAQAPEAPEVEGNTFVGWECSESSTLECVVDNADFWPIYAPKEQPEAAFARQIPEALPKGYLETAAEDGTAFYVFGEENVPQYAAFGTPEAGALGFYAADEAGKVQLPFVLTHGPVYPFTYLQLRPEQVPEGLVPVEGSEDTKEDALPGEVAGTPSASSQGSLWTSFFALFLRSAGAEEGPQIFAYGGTYVTPGVYRGKSGFYFCDEQGNVGDPPMFALAIPTAPQQSNVIMGVEDTTVMPGVVFDAMFGVSATDADANPLVVAITNITRSKAGYTYAPGSTTFVADTTEAVVYTISYKAYVSTDAAQTALLTATRKVTVFDSSREYTPGMLSVTFDKLPSSATTYSLSDDTTNNSIFTIKYTLAPNTVTNHTVLVVSKLAYGTDWGALKDADATIKSVLPLDANTLAIQLNDGLFGQVTIEFPMKRIPLSQALCEQWMDNGALPATNLSVKEYYMPVGALANVQKDITSTLKTQIRYFDSDISLENPATELTMDKGATIGLHTYQVYTYNAPAMQQQMLSIGWGSDGGNNLYYYTAVPECKDPNLMYVIPTVHYQDIPLVEIMGIKLYVPDSRLALHKLDKTPTARQTSLVVDSDYYKIWNDWQIGAPQTDEGGTYYLAKPPAGKRIFNNADAANVNKVLSYGMRLLWKLTDINQPLLGADVDTVYQAAVKSALLYRVPSENNPPANKAFEHDSPKILVMKKKPAVITQAYSPLRHGDNTSNQNVIIGSKQASQAFTYLTNSWAVYRAQRTEYVPVTDGACTQHYEFPYEIQPTSMTFDDLAQRPTAGLAATFGVRTEMGSMKYKTLDGVTHAVPQSEIDKVNAYYASLSGTAATVTFSAAGKGNPVTEVDVQWNRVLTESGLSYPLGIDAPVYNQSANSTSGAYATVRTSLAYDVATKHKDGTPIVNYEKAQAKYRVDFVDPATASFTPETPDAVAKNKNKFLWWIFKVPYCPDIGFEQVATNAGNLVTMVADGVTEMPIGNMYLSIGQLGEKTNILENPVIDFRTTFNGSYLYSNQAEPTLNGITEGEALAFLTGEFTATKAMSGWTFVYSTNQRSGAEYTLPELTGDTVVQLPMGEGEYFTSLLVKYVGEFDSGHLSDGGPWVPNDMDTRIDLMKNIEMRYLDRNPFTGEKLKVSMDYYSVAIQLRGYHHWDTCGEDGLPHIQTPSYPGKNVSIPASSPYEYPPLLLMNTERQITLVRQNQAANPEYTAPSGVQQVYQGNQTSGTFTFNVGSDTFLNFPVTTSGKGARFAFCYPVNSFNRFKYYAPWGISEAVYVELKDTSFLVDLENCSLYGVAYSSGNVLADVVEAGGRTFLKLQLAPWYQRTNGSFMVDGPDYNLLNVYVNSGTANAAGAVKLAFQTLPGTPTGFHYPIGDVYLDFSQLLDDYDAPTQSRDSMTRWNIQGDVQDTLGLSSSASNRGNKLFKYNFGSDSPKPYTVQVVEASVLGATLIPGKKDYMFDFATLTTRFKLEERDKLNGLVNIQAGTLAGVYDAHVYVSIPKKDVPVTYQESDRTWRTAVSNYSMFLTQAPQVLTNSTGKEDNLTILYTKDPAPTATSDYSYDPDTSGWETVTGICLVIGEMPMQSAVNLRLSMRAEEKGEVGLWKAYSSGPYTYRIGGAKAPPNTAQLPLTTWQYEDYVLMKPDASVFWDTQNENGKKDHASEKFVTKADQVVISLYEPDGETLIDTCAVGDTGVFYNGVALKDGEFILSSYKNEAGQILKISMPAGQTYTAKLTRQSTSAYTASKIDSDFDRVSQQLVLPELPTGGLVNLSAGLIKLPELVIEDQTFMLGGSVSGYSVKSFGKYMTGTMPAAPVYRMIYGAPQDTDILSFAETMDANNKVASPIIKPVVKKVGATTAKVWVENILGDKVEKTYTLTVVMPTVDVTAQKVWMDNSNAKGVRPESIALELLRTPKADGSQGTETVRTKTFTGTGDTWTYTFAGEDKYNVNVEPYTYTVQEASVEHYATETAGLTVKNTYRPEPVTYNPTVKKAVTGTVPLGGAPKVFSFTLTPQGGAPMPATATNGKAAAQAVAGDTVGFGDILFTQEGTYTYTIAENAKPAAGYTGYTFDAQAKTLVLTVTDTHKDGKLHVEATGTGANLTITNAYAPTPVACALGITKEIRGNAVLEGQFTFDLAAKNGAPMPAQAESAVAARTGEGYAAFGDIQFTVAGVYEYTITEREPAQKVPGYTYNQTSVAVTVTVTDTDGVLSAQVNPSGALAVIENSFAMPTRDVAVTKVWEDNSDALAVRPKSVTVALSRTPAKDGGAGPETVATKTFGDDGDADLNTWKHTFAGVDVYNDQGVAYTYQVQENGVNPNYSVAVTGDMDAGVTITNTLQLIAVDGEKVWDIRGGMPKPSSITVQLLRNREPLQTLVVTAATAKDPEKNRWAYSFSGLLAYDENGHAYRYTVAEQNVPEEFTATVAGTTITNLNPDAVEIHVRKQWDHTGAPMAERPQSVQVTLMRDGRSLGLPVTLSAETQWKHTFTVQKSHAEGHSFSVEEKPVPNYKATYSTDPDGTLVVTNQFAMPKVTVSGSKKWERVDGAAVDATLQKPTVTICLWRNQPNPKASDTPFKTTTISAMQSGYAFGSLERYDPNGTPYTYTVTETPTEGYTAALSALVVDKNGNVKIDITNTYTPAPVTWTPEIAKRVTGSAAPAEDYLFTLTKKAATHPMPAGSTGSQKQLTIHGAGTGNFGEMSFAAPGVYEYTVAESKGTTPGMTYDDSVLLFTVTVKDSYGALSVDSKVTKNGNRAEAVFTNQFKQPTGSLKISKTVTGTDANPNLDFRFEVKLSASGSYSYTGMKTGTVKNGDIITLKHNQFICIEGIPEGTAYAVTEQNSGAYTLSATGDAGVIQAGKMASAAFVNHLDKMNYTLTVRYWIDRVDGEAAAPSFGKVYAAGDPYRVVSPSLKGFEANKPVVWGTIQGNTVLDVLYTHSEYTLTVRYWYGQLGGEPAGETFQKTYDKGTVYSVQSPMIPNWSADRAVVSGVLEMDTVLDVVYRSNPYTLTVRYWFDQVGGEAAAETFHKSYAEGAAYNVQSPVVSGWKADQEKVSGIVTENTVLDVIYTAHTYRLTVQYIYADGTQAAPTVRQTGLKMGDHYGVDSPAIADFTASAASVEGTMPACDVERTVVYVKNNGSSLVDLLENEVPLGLGMVITNVGECVE